MRESFDGACAEGAIIPPPGRHRHEHYSKNMRTFIENYLGD
ncbi:MarR family transcriptional regulator [Brucella abortus LMN1]|nr:MarR family transcriptional regulator [Brucella melitensis ADMAS-G1]KFH22190.1 MarR family transcriptional regulator [Brucella abortus LMN1]